MSKSENNETEKLIEDMIKSIDERLKKHGFIEVEEVRKNSRTLIENWTEDECESEFEVIS